MIKHSAKIYRRAAFIILALTISGLLNICLFALQAKAASPKPSAPKINFTYDANGEACATETTREPAQNLNYPSAPMPQCCLAQNRNFDAVVNTANDQSAPSFVGLIFSPSADTNPENNFTYYTSQNIYPPPALLALISTVIRE